MLAYQYIPLSRKKFVTGVECRVGIPLMSQPFFLRRNTKKNKHCFHVAHQYYKCKYLSLIAIGKTN